MRTEPSFSNQTEPNSFRTESEFFQKQNQNRMVIKLLFCASLEGTKEDTPLMGLFQGLLDNF